MRGAAASVALMAVLLIGVAPAVAQHDHMDIYSSESGGGALVLDYDFDKKFIVFESFCAAGRCLFSTINPAFLSPEEDAVEAGLHRLDEGTRVFVEIVEAAAALTLNIDGVRLKNPGDSALLGAAPIHNHPSWQLVVPQAERGEYVIRYKLRSDSPAYGESDVYTSIVTNVAPELPAPCPSSPCPSDCDDDGFATAAEMRAGVAVALSGGSVEPCRSMDAGADGVITIDEIVAAAGVFLDGCPERQEATLAALQQRIFSPSCAITTCHDSASAAGNLVLAADVAEAELIDVVPDVDAAADAGLLRVTPGDPDQSFLYRKLVGPRPEWGSRMPLDGACLPPEQLDLVRRWILTQE